LPEVKCLAEDTRVLRGGAFNNNRRNARCAYRNSNDPDNWNNNNGFRVGVVSHIFTRIARITGWSGLPGRGFKDGWPESWLAVTLVNDCQANSNRPAPYGSSAGAGYL
jgi:hypothetical protein